MTEYIPVVLGKRFELRVDDLNEDHVIEVLCLACRRKGRVLATQLIRRHPGYWRLTELEKKFRCIECQSQEISGWNVYQLVSSE